MASFADFFSESGDEAKQLFLWGVLEIIVQQAAEPYIRDLQYAVNDFDPNVIPDPAVMAELVRRGELTQASGEANAKKLGFNSTWFDLLIKTTLTPLPPTVYITLARRGFISGTEARTLAGKSGMPASTFDLAMKAVTVPLSPQQLADLVLKEWLTESAGAEQANKSGIAAPTFSLMVKDLGEPPGLEQVLQWWRRGIMPWSSAPGTPSVEEAIRTSRIIATVWSTVLHRANLVPMAVAEAVDAVVENQIPRGTPGLYEAAASGETVSGLSASPTTGYGIAWANGIPPAVFDIMVNTRGNPPPPSELISLFRRGLIPWTGTGPQALTVQQGIYEGASKDKWEPIYKGLVMALPSLYYVIQMLKNGSITATKATQILTDEGYTAEVVTGIVRVGQATAVATAKALTESIITTLYADKAVDRAQALTMLTDIGYATTSATFILQTIDLKITTTAINSAITRIGNLYMAKKLTKDNTIASLSTLGITGTQATALITTWTLERAETVKILTESQIADAVKYTVITFTEGMTELQAIGYTPYDAWVILSVTLHGPQGTPPAKGPSPTGNIT
jgi:hypothetical protein